MQGLQYPLGYQVYYHGDNTKTQRAPLVDTQYNSSSDTERDSPPPLPPGEEDVTPQTGSSTSVTSSNQWATAEGNGSHDPDSMDLDEGSDCEDNAIQYTTPYGNQYTTPNTSQYTIPNTSQYTTPNTSQSGNQYSSQSQYPNHYANDGWYNVQGSGQDTSQYSNQCAPQSTSNDGSQYTAQDTNQYTAQDSKQYTAQDTNQYTTQDTNQYTTQDTSQIVSQPVYYGSNRLPQQQGWVDQWQPPPQQWIGQGYYGNNWNNYYQQYYNQQNAVQYNQQQQKPHPFTHQPYKQQEATNKSQPAKQTTQQQYKPTPPTVGDEQVATSQNR